MPRPNRLRTSEANIKVRCSSDLARFARSKAETQHGGSVSAYLRHLMEQDRATESKKRKKQ